MAEFSDELIRRAAECRECLWRSGESLYMAGKLIRETKGDTPHGLFTAWVKEKVGVSIRTASNLMGYTAVVDHAGKMGESTTNAGKGNLREKVLAVKSTIIYGLGSRNITRSRRDYILRKIWNDCYKTQNELVQDILASNRKVSSAESSRKRACGGDLSVADIGNDGVVRFSSDGGVGVWKPTLPELIEMMRAVSASKELELQ